MTTQISRQKPSWAILKYKSVIALVLLPVVLALYANSLEPSQIPVTLTEGVFPIALTVLAWGLAAKLAYKIRK